MSLPLALLLAALPARAAAPAAKPAYGILLLAHGGDADWDAQVARLRAQVDARVPTESAIGMADPATIRPALERLKARGVPRVVAVPLFVNSASEVMDQTRYVLGLSDRPSEVLRAAAERMASMPMPPGMAMRHMHMFSLERATTSLPVALTSALDDDPLVARVLLERARALSRDPARETVVLVAHGPVAAEAEPAWEGALARQADAVRRGGGFRAATYAILHDDAAAPVRAASVAVLRARVAEGAKAGRALVVPVLIARGGIEGKLKSDLAGLDYAWDGAALMPHAGFDAWVLARAAAAK